MLAQVEGGGRGVVCAREAGKLGFKLCLFGVTLLNSQLHAAQQVVRKIRSGEHPQVGLDLVPFNDLYAAVGFDETYAWESRVLAESSGHDEKP
mmetsp:Transcript_91023/g.257155  ORF Transcript_91023/g.257155 Transcript_91023/m.257155 type:complete len:93 (+) Transcript_91023:2-280(+)